MVDVTAKSPPLIEDLETADTSLEGLDDPFPTFRHLRETAPIVAVKRRGLIFYHATTWSAVSAVLNDNRFSKQRSLMDDAVMQGGKSGQETGFVITGFSQPNLLNTDPPHHTRLRSLVSQAFSPARIKKLDAVIAQQIDNQINTLSDRTEADLITDYAYPIAINMICGILGVPAKDQAHFRIWATAASSPHIIPDAPVTQLEGARFLSDYLANRIAEIREQIARGEPEDNLLTDMAQAQAKDDALTDDELLAMAILLLVAGHETTVGLIGSTLYRLGNDTDQRQKLIDTPELIDTAVEEFLRIDGGVMRTTFRIATQDIEIEGYLIPKGGLTTAALPCANRDPARFEDPERFDVTRRPSPNLAFGYGAHFCLGRNLARSETKMAIRAFLQRFPHYVPGKPVWARTVIRAPLSLPAQLGEEITS